MAPGSFGRLARIALPLAGVGEDRPADLVLGPALGEPGADHAQRLVAAAAGEDEHAVAAQHPVADHVAEGAPGLVARQCAADEAGPLAGEEGRDRLPVARSRHPQRQPFGGEGGASGDRDHA